MLLSPEELLDDNPHCLIEVQWGSYTENGGNITYPIAFKAKVFSIASTSALDNSSTNLSNLTYWHTTDTNYGTPSKVDGWYIAIGN